ncbi:hypothetical protein PRIPAC_76562 [Pristionchus pacificus]|uniref:Uncharacterized protein n=1 Tax=Pristionchus pacificus TaxID=54126 RepID=A0A2A6CRU8_PRIPA|nr:hypothetical protein PRIPAC_76562 [Pristionchus pacificus]|eukprot:PDM80787.1 hypothetical protein PRIPAC_35790 [Pristionchus pacificus]
MRQCQNEYAHRHQHHQEPKTQNFKERACRAAREAEIRAEQAEKLLDAKHGVLAGLKQPKIEKETIVKSEPIDVVEVEPSSTPLEQEPPSRKRNKRRRRLQKERKAQREEDIVMEETRPADVQPGDANQGVPAGLKQPKAEKETIVKSEPMQKICSEIVEVALNSTVVVHPPEENAAPIPVGRNREKNLKRRMRAKEKEAERMKLSGEKAETWVNIGEEEEGPQVILPTQRATEEMWAAREKVPSSLDHLTAFVRLKFVVDEDSMKVINFFAPLRITTIKMGMNHSRRYSHTALVTFATIEDARAAKDYQKKGCKIITSLPLPLTYKRFRYFTIYSGEKEKDPKEEVREEIEEANEVREEIPAGESTECNEENGCKKKRRKMDYLYNRLLEHITSK